MRHQIALTCAFCALFLAAGSGQQAVAPATLVLRNGKIVTVDAAMPEAQAIAIRGDRIAAVGSNDAIQPYVGPSTQVIDLRGQLAIPGLIESHGHFMGFGQSKLTLDLMDVKDWNEIVGMVAAAAKQAKPGEWILGRGWHQEKWSSVPKPNVEGFPFHDELSKVSPNNPVMLTHASGHASFVNAKAMEASGLTAKTPDPAGGEILKDTSGRPIGLLRETASSIAGRALEAWRSKKTEAERRADAFQQIDLAVKASLEKGVTSFHDAGVPFTTVDIYKQAAADGRLGIRLWVMVRDSNENLAAKMAQYKAVGLNSNHLTIAAIKVTADGALGSRGALMLEPYSDSPASVGLATNSLESIAVTAKIARDTGVQLCVHCIGDRANREVLNIYERAFQGTTNTKELRWRIEHAQHISAADIPRFGQLGVIPAMQGIHATSDAPYVPARLGAKRAEEGAYVWQKLMKSGAIIANGTDVPVERIDPMANFHATVTRKTKDGSVFYGAQKMSRAEALKSYTWNGAFAAKEETLKGSLVAGKLADITVLSKDIMTIPEDEILTTTVSYTIVGGKVAYAARLPVFRDGFEYVVNRDDSDKSAFVSSGGWTGVKSEPANRGAEAWIYTVPFSSLAGGCGTSPNGSSRGAMLEMRPDINLRQTDGYLQLGNASSGVKDFLPADSWWQMWVCVQRVDGSRESVFGNRNKFWYVCNGSYGCHSHAWMVGTTCSVYNPHNATPLGYPCTKGFFWTVGSADGESKMNYTGPGADRDTADQLGHNQGSGRGAGNYVPFNTWVLLKVHFNTSSPSYQVQAWQKTVGAPFEQIMDWRNGVSGLAWTGAGVGHRELRMPTTVGHASDRQQQFPYWMIIDDMAIASSESDLPTYGTPIRKGESRQQ